VLFIGAGRGRGGGLADGRTHGAHELRSLAAVVAGVRKRGAAVLAQRTDRDFPGRRCCSHHGGSCSGSPSARRAGRGARFGGTLVAACGPTLFAFVFVPGARAWSAWSACRSNPTRPMALVTLAGTGRGLRVARLARSSTRARRSDVGTIVRRGLESGESRRISRPAGSWRDARLAAIRTAQSPAAVACWAVAFVVVAIGHDTGFEDGCMPAPRRA